MLLVILLALSASPELSSSTLAATTLSQQRGGAPVPPSPDHPSLHHSLLTTYQHNLTLGQQQRALVSIGSSLRLRKLLATLASGGNVSIGILGGSISWGCYMQRGVNDWFALFTAWLRQTFPAATVASRNGCVPATTAEYASMCLEKFVDAPHVDLVFLEYSLNDGYVDTSVRTEHGMAFERLIRKLLLLPRQPAVVLMQVLPQGIRASASPMFWWSVQDHYGVLAQYYQLPWLSMRDAMWHEVVAGAPGFTVPEIYPEQEQEMQRHPSELAHKYMADVAVAMMQQVYLDMLLEPMPLDDVWGQRLAQVPEPMFANNYESSNLACFVGDNLTGVVAASPGWAWRNDGTADKPKWGFSTTTVGAVLSIQVDTRMAANVKTGATTAAAEDLGRAEAALGGNAAAADSNAALLIVDSTPAHQRVSEESPTLHHEEGVQSPSGPTGRRLQADALGKSTAAGSTQQDVGRQEDPTVREAAAPTGAIPVLQMPHLQQHWQQAEHSAEWWEAQQAQEEQQQRSKLEESNRGWQAGDVLVWLGYTKTWKGASRAVLRCAGGCTCRNTTVDGHHRWRTTQSFMAKLYTTQAANCTIQVEVLPKSSSNGTFFKVSGVMVTRRITSYDSGDYTDVLLMNAMEGEDYKLKSEGHR